MTRKTTNSILLKRGALGALIAAAINYLIFFISKGVGISFILPPRMADLEPVDLSSAGIILSTVLLAVFATILILILNRFSKRPLNFFIAIALIVLVVSSAPVFLIEAPVNTKILLGIMHMVAAGAIIVFLRSAYQVV